MLRGLTTAHTLILGFDEQQPEHCFEQSNDCTKDALSAADFLHDVSFDGRMFGSRQGRDSFAIFTYLYPASFLLRSTIIDSVQRKL